MKNKKPLTETEKQVLIAELWEKERQRQEAEKSTTPSKLTKKEKKIWKTFEDTGILNDWKGKIIDISNQKNTHQVLTFKNCLNLTDLKCKNLINPHRLEQETGLVIENCPQLSYLDASCNKFGFVDLENSNSPLEEIHLYNNKLTKFDASPFANTLKFLKIDGQWKDIENNEKLLEELNLTGCTKLESLYCQNNNLLKLNLNDCVNLKNLDCSYNFIEKLKVKHLENIVSLHCHHNCCLSLDCRGLKRLKDLNVANNNIRQLHITLH